MKRILVSMPDELHELMKELAVRKKTSVSRLLLAAVEDAYEDEIDVIAGEKGLAEYLADPSSAISWDELKLKLRRQAGMTVGDDAERPIRQPGQGQASAPRKKSGIRS